jgi:hypothetical protein
MGAGARGGTREFIEEATDALVKTVGEAARSHTKFVTDLVSMYANAIRNGLPG